MSVNFEKLLVQINDLIDYVDTIGSECAEGVNEWQVRDAIAYADVISVKQAIVELAQAPQHVFPADCATAPTQSETTQAQPLK